MVETFGEVLRRWRDARGYSLRELARRAHLDPGHLSRLESGRRPATRDLAMTLDQALEAGGELAASTTSRGPWPLAADGWGRRDAEALADALTHTPPAADNAAALAHEWLVTEPPQLYEVRAGRRIGAAAVGKLRDRVHQLRLLDDHLGGADTYAVVSAELEATATLLRTASYSEQTARALLSTLAELCQLAGWVAADDGRTPEARRLYLTGVRAAHAADDPTGAANCLSSLAYLAANTGDLREAVLLARTAATGAGPTGGKGVALQWERVAWSHARAGDDGPAGRALHTVEDTYGRPNGEDPPWAYWLTPDEIEIMAGRVWTQLRRPLRAVPILRRAVATYGEDPGRETALYLTWLAEALLQAREVEEAADAATRALRLSRRAGSARLGARLAEISAQLAAFTGSPAADAFDDEYRTPA